MEWKEVYDHVALYFYCLVKLTESKRGRPRKNKGRGIINRSIDISYSRELVRRKKKEEIERFEEQFLRIESLVKLGEFAKREHKDYLLDHSQEEADERLGSIDATFNYLYDNDIITKDDCLKRIIPKDCEEVHGLRLPKGTLDLFLALHGIDPKEKYAIKQRISRARKRRS